MNLGAVSLPTTSAPTPFAATTVNTVAFWLFQMLAGAQAFAGAAIITRLLAPLPPPRRKTGNFHPHWLRKSSRLFLTLSVIVIGMKASLWFTGRTAFLGPNPPPPNTTDTLGEAIYIVAGLLSIGAFLCALSILAQTLVLTGRVRRRLRDVIEARQQTAPTHGSQRGRP